MRLIDDSGGSTTRKLSPAASAACLSL